ncbi:MAG: hypothetical protein E7367_02315 [Clostridiales bacterium]|nr:hypothetical protein [Clostridiales bacterium]
MKNFNDIKRKLARNAFLRSGILGGSAGVASASIGALVCELLKVKVEPWIFVLGGIGLGAVVFGTLLLCLYPFERKLARKLDDELGREERVQTMLEFASDEKEMSVLQRKDTEARLAALPATYTQFKRIWQCIAAVCLAVATCASAVVVPMLGKGSTGGGGNGDGGGDSSIQTVIPFEVSTAQLVALRELIEYVQDSGMQDEPKTATVAALEDLLEKIVDVEAHSEMLVLVSGTIVAVDAATEAKNTGYELATAFEKAEAATLRKLANAVGATDIERFTDQYVKFWEAFKEYGEQGATAKDTIETFSTRLQIALAMSQVDGADELVQALKALNEAVVKELDPSTFGYYTQESWANRMETVFGTCQGPIANAMNKQIVNNDVRDYTIDKLCEIFGLDDANVPPLSQDYTPTTGGEDDKDDSNLNDGGLGTGDVNYGSNELIYDPETGELKPYGEVFAKYYAIYTDAVHQGKIDPNLEKILQAYFDMLATNKKE